MADSESAALPLGYTPMRFRSFKILQIRFKIKSNIFKFELVLFRAVSLNSAPIYNHESNSNATLSFQISLKSYRKGIEHYTPPNDRAFLCFPFKSNESGSKLTDSSYFLILSPAKGSPGFGFRILFFTARIEHMDTLYYVYILVCHDGTFYTGYTPNLGRRLQTHNHSRGAKYTKARLPVYLVYHEVFLDRHEALSREYQIKQLTRLQKLELVTSRPFCLISQGQPFKEEKPEVRKDE